MKFLLLHGTSATSKSNWFPWLKAELEKLGHEVWAPDLPDADRPNIETYWKYLSENSNGWDFSDNVWIGHSSGAVAILGLLQKLPQETKINSAILAGAFTKRLAESPSWAMLKDLFDEAFDSFDYEKIKQKSDKFIFVHSKDDPICDIDQARELHDLIGGEMIEFEGMKHFSVKQDPRFTEFPELLEIVKTKVL